MLSAEVKLLCSIAESSQNRRTFKAIKLASGLSATWLSRKLKELVDAGVITRVGRFYALTDKGKREFGRLGNYAYPLFLLEKASLFTKKVSKNPHVESVILFGSLAQGRADARSDVDLLVIVKDEAEYAELERLVNKLAYRYSIYGELLVVRESSFVKHAEETSPLSLIFGVLEGYRVMFDRHNKMGRLLREAKERVLSRYTYVQRARLWVKK